MLAREHAGMRDQYSNTMPSKNFVNGSGIPSTQWHTSARTTLSDATGQWDRCIAPHPDQGKQDVRRKCLLKVMLTWHPLKAMTQTTLNKTRHTIAKLLRHSVKMYTWNVRQRRSTQMNLVHMKPRELHIKPTATSQSQDTSPTTTNLAKALSPPTQHSPTQT